jgi:hypothetical protein
MSGPCDGPRDTHRRLHPPPDRSAVDVPDQSYAPVTCTARPASLFQIRECSPELTTLVGSGATARCRVAVRCRPSPVCVAGCHTISHPQCSTPPTGLDPPTFGLLVTNEWLVDVVSAIASSPHHASSQERCRTLSTQGVLLVKPWYVRMADIPGIQFAGSPAIDRASLVESPVRPSVRFGSLSWPVSEGFTSSSPAHRRAFAEFRSMDRDDLVRWVWEGLELPGEPSDYHFLLQQAVEQLWSNRRGDPAGLYFAETFAYLDLVLIEAAPQAVALNDADLREGFVRITTLERLLTILEREGSFRDALAVSRRAQRFGERYQREGLEAKVAALSEEQM